MHMGADIGQAKRLRVMDEYAQDAVPLREVAYTRAGGPVDAEGEEPLEAVAAVVQHAQRGVASAGQVAGSLQHGVEHRLGVQIRYERATDLEESTKLNVPELVGEISLGNVGHVTIVPFGRSGHDLVLV